MNDTTHSTPERRRSSPSPQVAATPLFNRLRTKLLLGVVGLLTVIATFVFFYFPERLREQADKGLSVKASSVVDMTAYTVFPALIFGDSVSLQESIGSALQNSEIVFVLILDERCGRAQLFGDTTSVLDIEGLCGTKTTRNSAELITVSAPVMFEGRTIGTVILGMSKQQIVRDVEHARWTAAVLSLGILIIGAIGAGVLSARISAPLERVAATAQRISAGDMDVRAPVDSRDEVGVLARTFNEMVDVLVKSQGEIEEANRELERRVQDRTRALSEEVDQRRTAEMALRISEERNRTLVESSPEAIAVLSNGVFAFVNPAFVHLSAAPSLESLLGSSPNKLFSAEALARLQSDADRQTSTTSGPEMQEWELRRLDGTTIFVEISAIRLEFREGPAVQWIARDITERRKNAAREATFSALGERLNASTTEFEASMTIADAADVLFGWDAITVDLYFPDSDVIQSILNIDTIDGSKTNVPPQFGPKHPSPRSRKVLTQGAELALRRAGEGFNKDAIPFGDTQRPSMSIITVPIRNRATPTGVLSIQSYAVDRYSQRDIVGVQALADYCGGALERIRNDQALRQSEEQYRDLVENINDIYFMCDARGRIVYGSPSLYTRSGYDPIELLGSRYHLLIAPEDRHVVIQHYIERVAEGAMKTRCEFRAIRKDGTVVWVEQSTRIVRNPEGKVTGFRNLVRDITERRRAEEEIKKLLRAVEQTDEVIFMADASGAITYANPAFTDLYGYGAEEVIGKNPRILQSGNHDASFYQAFWETLHKGDSYRGEFHNRSKDGRVLTVEVAVSPLRDIHNSLTGFIAVQRDVTERRLAENERRKLEEHVAQAQKIESIGTLAGGIAHDFNNLLAIIMAQVSLIEMAGGNVERIAGHLASILASASRGANLVKQILTFARKTQVSFEAVHVNAAVQEMVAMLRETFPRTIEFEEHTSLDDPVIQADATQIHQTLLNLCVNAREAMPQGGRLRLGVRVCEGSEVQQRFPEASTGSYVCVSVSDTGPGMDASTIQRIFEPFFTTKEVGKGTGLGLAVVHGIVHGHRGHIDVQSRPGSGTAFLLYFPLSHISSVKSKDPQGKREMAGGSETILLVEDEEFLQTAVVTILNSYGYSVLTAQDGIEALAMYRREHDTIGLVLTDLGLPKLDGVKLSEQLKILDPKVRIVVASGYIDPETRRTLESQGIQAIVSKPYKPIELLRVIRDVLDSVG